ncbi:MAG: DUF1638 domain-containing protein [Granulosicoccus sp.]
MGIALQGEDDEFPDSTTASRTLVIACGAIAHELTTLIKANRWQHLDIQCLPAKWHNTPDRITPAIEKKIQQYKDQYQRIFIAYADCGTGGQLDALLLQHGIERLPGDHCYGFFSGQEVFEAMAEAELGTFYLTDYLVDHFQRLIMDELGITRHPELRELYFGHYTRFLYLRQDTNSDKCEARMQKARAAAQALGLKLEIHDTGLKPFEHSLAPIQIIAR